MHEPKNYREKSPILPGWLDEGIVLSWLDRQLVGGTSTWVESQLGRWKVVEDLGRR